MKIPSRTENEERLSGKNRQKSRRKKCSAKSENNEWTVIDKSCLYLFTHHWTAETELAKLRQRCSDFSSRPLVISFVRVLKSREFMTECI